LLLLAKKNSRVFTWYCNFRRKIKRERKDLSFEGMREAALIEKDMEASFLRK